MMMHTNYLKLYQKIHHDVKIQISTASFKILKKIKLDPGQVLSEISFSSSFPIS